MTPPEIIPAEQIQADEPKPVISTRLAIAIAIFVAGVITHHAIWSAGL